MTHPTPKLECKNCRHDGDEDIPFSACKVCYNMSEFSSKEEADKARHTETLDTAFSREENLL